MKNTTSRLFATITALLFATGALTAADLKVDASASKITWTGEKVTGDSHVGNLKVKSGNLKVNGDTITGGQFVIDMTSITNIDVKDPKYNAKLVGHLKSEDFFHVDQHKEAKLVIKNAKQDGKKIKITADMTIRGVTKPVEFTASVAKASADRFVAYARFSFDRTDYNVKYNSGKFFSGLGDKVIKDKIDVIVRLVATN